MRATLVALIILLAISLAPVATADPAADANGKLQCTAFAVSTGGARSRPVAERLDIVVERTSTEAERQRLVETLKKGQDELLDTLQELPRVGYIRTPTTLAWDLHYAHETPGEDGGRRIVIATDRPISIWEAANRPRTIDYPFTFIELRLNEQNEGEGKLSLFTQVIPTNDGRHVQLENYDTQPVQLNEVRCE